MDGTTTTDDKHWDATTTTYVANATTTPAILHNDLPLDGTTTTTLSFETGIHPTMMDSNSHSVLTDTLSSFSSGYNNNLLSTYSSTTSSASRRSSMQFTKPVEVRETLDASVTENADGHRQLRQYILKKEIGKGAFGKVHLAVDEKTGTGYAVKEFSKSKLRKKDKANLFKLGPRGRGRGRRGPEAPSPKANETSPLDLIRGEVAILKKLHHPNIVKLYEVLDVAQEDSMYMVFEMCEKGVLMPVSLTETYESVFTDAECRDVFQQIILGIEYLHEHDIIHRDIKPDNLLRSGDGTVKIVDFGVSEMFDKKGNDMTKKSAGSPAFMAPELCRPDHGEVSGKATDIWSMGVTLYCLRYGRLPYVSESILEMHRIIREDPLVIPPDNDQRFVDLIKKLLDKDPNTRITIEQLREDPWVTNSGREPLISMEENTASAVTEITDEDLNSAIQRINGLVTVIKAISKFKRGIKSPSARSSVNSPTLEQEAPWNNVSEEERMEDAVEDDDDKPSAPKVIVAMVEAEKEMEAAAAAEKGSTEPTKDTLEKSLERVSLEEARPDLNPEQPTESAPEDMTMENQAEAKAEAEVEVEGPPVPGAYQVCDMVTMKCHWVLPSSTREEPAPVVSDDQDKDASESVSAAMDGAGSMDLDETDEKMKQQRSPTIHVASTNHEHQTTLSSSSKTETHETRSERSSPSQSLAPGPRLVGKLSRERLAMFERST
ncbi:hypothetical protein BGZ51_008358 [Haplosporangium sp. Z 767]|nr:hypothetical protein BGZ50_008570 [Haplosporangium sp. Z 11]KAF9177800.1 hypothetical protein BGZ51_008358 [Haplosporangium sp. Z 767]